MSEHVDLIEDPYGAPYPEEVQVLWDHICDLAVVTTREPTRETVVAALEAVLDHLRSEVLAIHRAEANANYCEGCYEGGGYDGASEWPCATVKALTGGAP